MLPCKAAPFSGPQASWRVSLGAHGPWQQQTPNLVCGLSRAHTTGSGRGGGLVRFVYGSDEKQGRLQPHTQSTLAQHNSPPREDEGQAA